MADTTDVAVVGGGPAGLAVALSPALGDRRVALVEASRWSGFRAGETLAPTSVALLDALGVADVLDTTAFACEGTTAAWASDELDYQDHWQTTHGPAHFLARPAFDAALAARVAARGATILRETRVTGVRGEPGAWVLELATPTGSGTLGARVLVDASGRRAVVGRRLGRPPVRFDRLVAAMARVPAGESCPPRVLVEARPDGWWYASPVPGGEVVVAYLTDGDLARHAGASRQDGFALLLAETTHVRGLVGDLPAGLRPVVRPAWSAMLPAAAGDGWIAVGDAATSFDPLTSTGMHNALRTAAEAVDVLAGGGDGAEYVHARRRDFERFVVEHSRVYGRQAQFDTPFWQRRRLEPVSPPAAAQPARI